MKRLLLMCASLIFSVSAWSADDNEPPIPAGTLIEVESFNLKSRTYDIVMVQYEAQGPNYATPEDLARAVKALDGKKLSENPRHAVGHRFLLDDALRLQPVLKTEAKRKRAK